jgi:hypothetical protein
MIFVFFVPGMFGSTIEALLSSFTVEYASDEASLNLTTDGSMHTFAKQAHLTSLDSIRSAHKRPVKICTPIYPMIDAHLSDIVQELELREDDNVLMIHANSIESAELNMLFQYYKIAKGVSNKSLGIFCVDNKQNIINWNKYYTSWKDMQLWELREWLSLFYTVWVQEWINSKDVKFSKDVFPITNTEILDNLESTFIKIVNHLNLTLTNESELSEFCKKWTKAQQYIVDEYNLIEPIVQNSIDNVDFDWQELNIITESIIQQKIRLAGYEIRCYNLNKFPTNSKELNKLLEKN